MILNDNSRIQITVTAVTSVDSSTATASLAIDATARLFFGLSPSRLRLFLS